MWSLSRSARAALLVAGLMGGAAALSGCSFTPVYGDTQAQNSYALQYAEPSNRLSQIIYQDLSLRLPATTDLAAPELSVSATSRSREITRSQVRSPFENREMTVTARIRLVSGDKVILNATRSASAAYTTNGQVLADRAAAEEAAERAAHALAETVRLTVIAALTES